jgi:hypothetical protein
MTKTQLGACVGVVVVLLAGFVAAAKYPAVFGPPLEDGPVLATAGPNRGRPCEDCIFVPVSGLSRGLPWLRQRFTTPWPWRSWLVRICRPVT